MTAPLYREHPPMAGGQDTPSKLARLVRTVTGGDYAPAAIWALYNALTTPGKQMGGILGDAAHTYGYHRGRNQVSKTDYSVAESYMDKLGDGNAASALDISLPADQMKAVSAHLMAGMQAKDNRLRSVREFFGTLNGTTVTGWDGLENSYTSSDTSHLWHVHLSFYREYANDGPTLLDVAAFLNQLTPSGGGQPVQEDDMTPDQAQQLADLHSFLFTSQTPKGATGAACIVNSYLGIFEGGDSMPDAGRSIGASLENLTVALITPGGPDMPDGGKSVAESLAEIHHTVAAIATKTGATS